VNYREDDTTAKHLHVKEHQFGFLLQKLLSEIEHLKEECLANKVTDPTTNEPFDPLVLFYDKIQQLFESELDSAGELNHPNANASFFLKTINQLIDENISNPNLSIGTFCKAAHLERTQVYRKLKAEIGLSPTDLITKKRMEHASRLLIQYDLSIGEVAARCGYHELSYFDKVFVKYYGFTPTEYRKMRNQNRMIRDK